MFGNVRLVFGTIWKIFGNHFTSLSQILCPILKTNNPQLPNKQMKYQTAPNSKTAPKRGLTLMEEFTITLRRHLHIFFSFSVTARWVCFLATILKEVLVFQPSQEEVGFNLHRSLSKQPDARILIDCTQCTKRSPPHRRCLADPDIDTKTKQHKYVPSLQ